ncbi:hypothetical protein IWZ01DRAFT_528689 [Phyllosticta capitalensis]
MGLLYNSELYQMSVFNLTAMLIACRPQLSLSRLCDHLFCRCTSSLLSHDVALLDHHTSTYLYNHPPPARSTTPHQPSHTSLPTSFFPRFSLVALPHNHTIQTIKITPSSPPCQLKPPKSSTRPTVTQHGTTCALTTPQPPDAWPQQPSGPSTSRMTTTTTTTLAPPRAWPSSSLAAQSSKTTKTTTKTTDAPSTATRTPSRSTQTRSRAPARTAATTASFSSKACWRRRVRGSPSRSTRNWSRVPARTAAMTASISSCDRWIRRMLGLRRRAPELTSCSGAKGRRTRRADCRSCSMIGSCVSRVSGQ